MKLLYILLLLPSLLFGQLLQEKDKQLHFAAGMLSSAAGYTFIYNKTGDKKKAMAGAVAASLLAGIAKETYDNINGGAFDKRDILATGLGGVTVSITIPILSRKTKKKKRRTRYPSD